MKIIKAFHGPSITGVNGIKTVISLVLAVIRVAEDGSVLLSI